jgi:hypothetical protein
MHPQIAAFARLAGENAAPTRVLEGQKTLISRTMHDFAYDGIHDEIVVTSPLAHAVLTFRGGANGEEPPLRVIQGPLTQIRGTPTGAVDKVNIDPVNNEIYVPVVPNRILVFDRNANGNVAPKRILNHGGSIQVDSVHNLLVVNVSNQMLIYDRTASGDDKPKAIIQGPNSGMSSMANASFAVYPPKGWIIASGGEERKDTSFVGVWSINDNGDVPPRYKLRFQQLTGFVATGFGLDTVHKEVIFSAAGSGRARPDLPRTHTVTGAQQAILTFSWPEIF